MLYNDPYYSQSFRSFRYDDLYENGVLNLGTCSVFPGTFAANTVSRVSLPSAAVAVTRVFLLERVGGSFVVRGGKYGVPCPGALSEAAVAEAAGKNALVAPAATLGGQLCARFAAQKALMDQKKVSRRAVGAGYLQAFLRRARYYIDDHILVTRGYPFRDALVDGRRSFSPTHDSGIGPNCGQCLGGWFTDATSLKRVRLVDRSHDAFAVLRLIGFLLKDSMGTSCPELYDGSNRPLMPPNKGGAWF